MSRQWDMEQNQDMSETGVVFDIKELAVFDGPGLRVTVFLKGCPLRCRWCHNPEGLGFRPQRMKSANGCTGCGKCDAVCPTPHGCTACGRCAAVCPRGLIRIAGTACTAAELAAKLLKDAAYLRASGGGYTFSGGEPTAQPAFLLEVLRRLRGNHRALETSGHCPPAVFRALCAETELVMLDIKLADTRLHRRYTGVGNEWILENLRQLKAGAVPFVVRVPLIPGVNDTAQNLAATAALLADAPALQGVELLPYHITAGAKYAMLGMPYQPGFDETKAPAPHTGAFEQMGIPCRVL